jgi:hypothetical protein
MIGWINAMENRLELPQLRAKGRICTVAALGRISD